MYSDNDDPEGPGFPIRTSADQSLFAAPHGFSQRITSFIACVRQGIHQMLLGHLITLIINAHRIRACRLPAAWNRDRKIREKFQATKRTASDPKTPIDMSFKTR